LESGNIVTKLEIPKGRYKVCFEVGAESTNPASEYFLGFKIDSTDKRYIIP